VGVVSIPLMKRTGYPPYFAGAVEAVASTGGCIMPPVMGAAAFIMAELLGLPYSQVVLVAIVPAVLYFLGLFIQVDLRAAKQGLRGIPGAELPSFKGILQQSWVYGLPILILVYGLFGWHLRPEVAAMYALGVLLAVAWVRPATRSALKGVLRTLEEVTHSMLQVTIICAAAGLVIGVVSYTGLGLSMSRVLTTLGGGTLLWLAIFTAIASVILGMGMPVTASYLFLAVLAAPAMVNLGVPPLLAHLFVFYFGAYSFLTPPICLAAYAAASIAGAPMLQTAWQAIKLAAAGYIVPFIFIYRPAMVFMGHPGEIVAALVDALLAVLALAIALEGYFRRPLSAIERGLFVGTSLALFIPGWPTRITGLTMFALLVAYSLYGWRNDKRV